LATKPYRSTREIPKDMAELILEKILAVNPKLKAVMEKKGIVCK
jgi:hypothetical protein